MKKMLLADKCKSFDCFRNLVSDIDRSQYEFTVEESCDDGIIVSTEDDTVAQYLDTIFDVCCKNGKSSPVRATLPAV